MSINITADPPTDILICKQKYAKSSRICLGVALCSLPIGFFGIYATSSYSNIIANIGMGLFLVAGIAFVYYTEKYMEYRPIKPEQRFKLEKLSLEFKDIATYRTKVIAENRALTVIEYEAAEHHGAYCRAQNTEK
ncbi:MAG: hypothetical protein OEM02_16670 [Desulfobulbaceae bacterium]|nr:hypothetical protein [Desulfobulbaceae bacterium]